MQVLTYCLSLLGEANRIPNPSSDLAMLRPCWHSFRSFATFRVKSRTQGEPIAKTRVFKHSDSPKIVPNSLLVPVLACLGPVLACLSPSWAVSNLSWACLDLSWGCLGLSWACLGPVLGLSWPVAASLGPVLGPSWACHCLSQACLGAFLHIVPYLLQ